MTFRYSGDELEALDQATNYHHWILAQFRPHLGKRALEVGGGIGTFSALLLAETPVERLTVVEPAENLFPRLAGRLAGDPRVTLVHGHLDDLSPSIVADCAILVNVLEHVADVAAFLAALRGHLVENGRLLLLVPAGPRLYGTLDEAFGHHRRYTKPGLARTLAGAGFHPRVLRYFNGPGALAWLVAGRILRRRTLRARDVALYDRLVVPWIARLEARWAPPCGQSLLAIAERAASPEVRAR